MSKFGRVWRLEFVGDGIQVDPITQLRIAFEVEKRDGLKLDAALITVWNLSEPTRRAVARPERLDSALGFKVTSPLNKVRLAAGYESDTSQIFAGDILWAINSKVGPDWKTEMQCYGNLFAAQNSLSQISFAEPTPAADIVRALLSSLNLSITFTDAAAAKLQGQVFDKYVSSGLAFREAHRLLKNRFGLAFTLSDDGNGLVYDPTSARDPQTPKSTGNTISKDTGLIGTPRIVSEGIQVRALLRPHMVLFERFFVESATTTGSLTNSPGYSPDYFARSIRHVGDSHGEDWYTEIDGVYTRLSVVP